jgi:hypothetical protein
MSLAEQVNSGFGQVPGPSARSPEGPGWSARSGHATAVRREAPVITTSSTTGSWRAGALRRSGGSGSGAPTAPARSSPHEPLLVGRGLLRSGQPSSGQRGPLPRYGVDGRQGHGVQVDRLRHPLTTRKERQCEAPSSTDSATVRVRSPTASRRRRARIRKELCAARRRSRVFAGGRPPGRGIGRRGGGSP